MTPRGLLLRVLSAGWVLVAVSLALATSAQAQNKVCPTAPNGDSSNKCASTAFVQQALPTPGGTSGQIQTNNGAGGFGGFTASGDFTINTATGVGTLNTVTTAKGGTGTNNSTNSANDVLASNGANGNFVHTALLTLINTVCTASPSTCGNLFGYILPAWYGAVCDGTTNDATALQTAVTAASGKVLLLPSGSGCVTNTTLTVSANTVIKGTGRDTSGVISTITAGNATFYMPGVSNITLQDFACTGTDTATSWSVTNYGCARVTVAGSSVSNISLINLKLSGFNQTYWIYANAGGAGNITNFTVRNLLVTTALADVPNDPTPSNDSNGIITIQSFTGGNGQIIQALIADNIIAGDYACFGVTTFGNHYKPRIENNIVSNIGAQSTSHCTNSLASTNAYGILVYDDIADGNPPINVSVIGNTILNNLSAGIYFTGDGTVGHNAASFNSTQGSLIANNVISGQSAQDDSGVGRGAIVVDFLTDVEVSNNYMQANYGGVAVQSQRTGVVSVLANTCTTAVAAAAGTPYCIRLGSGINGSSNTDTRAVRSNALQTTGASSTSIRTDSATGARFNDVDISNNTISSAVFGLNLGAAFTGGTIMVSGNSFAGTNTTAAANFGSITGNLYLQGNKLPSLTVAGLPAAVNGSSVFVSDGAPASGPCTGTSTGSTAFRQNGAWKCF